jgi:hypothetical protein
LQLLLSQYLAIIFCTWALVFWLPPYPVELSNVSICKYNSKPGFQPEVRGEPTGFPALEIEQSGVALLHSRKRVILPGVITLAPASGWGGPGVVKAS